MILFQFFLDVLNHDSDHANNGNDEGSKGQSAKMVSESSIKTCCQRCRGNFTLVQCPIPIGGMKFDDDNNM